MRTILLAVIGLLGSLIGYSHNLPPLGGGGGISGETIVLTATVSTDITTNYLVIESLTLKPKANGPLIITASSTQSWYAKIYETTDNTIPTLGKNFVRTEVALGEFPDEFSFASADNDNKLTSFDYSDGLGRPTQTVVSQYSPSAKDFVTFHKYNSSSGIEELAYLPFTRVASNGGEFSPNDLGEQDAFYSSSTSKVASDDRTYSFTDFEKSPLGRPKSALGPGTDWSANNKKMLYDYIIHNGTSDPIKTWKINANNTSDKKEDFPQSSANYGNGQIQITQVTSEQGIVSQTCVDNRGLTIAERTKNGSSWITTFYVYDDFGQLRFIIPPKIADVPNPSLDQVSGLMFSYVYDGRGRLTHERAPGQDWTYYCYDKWDRVVLSQDPSRRLSNSNDWTFYKYDINNRLIMTGRKRITTNPDSWWSGTAKSSNAARYETRNTGNSYGYTSTSSLPTTINEVYTITYYDDYLFKNSTGWDAEAVDFSFKADNYGLSQQLNVKGLTTGSKVLNLENNKWLNTIVYYNKYYQPIQIIAENHLGGWDRISSDINFKGELLRNKLTHKKSSSTEFTYEQKYDYDHASRLLSVINNINGEGEVLLSSYEYNELGQLVDKKLHSTNGGSSFLQSIDYRYNIRGWLQTINNPALTNDGTTNNETNDFFGAKYHYQTAPTIGTTVPRFDGSLAAFEWKNAAVPAPGGTFGRAIVGYTYDNLGQLTLGKYATGNGTAWNGNSGKYDESVTYKDDNGNIDIVTRMDGGSEPLDDLKYTYLANSNKLSYVDDTGDKTKGYKDKILTGEFSYDKAGNQTRYLDKDIDSISYNHLQMVTKIEFHDGTTINYSYDAVGNRLSKTVKDPNGTIIGKIDYVGNIEYANDEIAHLYTDEGRAFKQNGKFHYEYHITDHQGNNRISFGVLPDRKVYECDFEQGTNEPEFSVPSSTVLVSTSFNHTLGGVTSNNLTGGANKVVGAAKVIPIGIDDVVNFEMWAKFASQTTGNNQNLLNAVTSAFSTAATSSGVSESVKSAINSSLGGSGLLATGNSNNLSGPSAYLNILFFRPDGTCVNSLSNYVPVAGTTENLYEQYTLASPIKFTEAGYLYVYLANEKNNGYNVFFDDIVITHEIAATTAQVTQVNDYYPMGSLMASSWTKEDYLSPGMMYQSFFSDYDSLAGTYDFLLRNYDPLLGRWWQSDPYNQFANPYNGMGNRAHSSIDPDGGVVPLLVDMAIWAVVGGYAGGYISSGDPRPWNWHNEDWAWVAGGAIVGAGFGYGVDFLGDHLSWNDGSYLTRSNPEGKVKWANGDRPGFKWKSDLKEGKFSGWLSNTYSAANPVTTESHLGKTLVWDRFHFNFNNRAFREVNFSVSNRFSRFLVFKGSQLEFISSDRRPKSSNFKIGQESFRTPIVHYYEEIPEELTEEDFATLKELGIDPRSLAAKGVGVTGSQINLQVNLKVRNLKTSDYYRLRLQGWK